MKLCQVLVIAFAAMMVVSCGKKEEAKSEPAPGPRRSVPTAARDARAVIHVTKEQMDAIGSLPEDLVCFTPAKNPVKTFEGLKDNEFAAWVGGDMPQRKLMAAFGREDTVVGLRMMGTGGFSFNNEPDLRLFVTLEQFADDILKGGGVRIQFREKGGLSAKDRELNFGKDGISVIWGVDEDDPTRFAIRGPMGIKNNQMWYGHADPGAVVVVGVDHCVIGDEEFSFGQILLRTTEHDLVLAPPDTRITISKTENVLGHELEAGAFVVPDDSRIPGAKRD